MLIGPLHRSPTRVFVLSPEGRLTARPASGCLAAGPNIACFRKSTVDVVFPNRFESFRTSSYPVAAPNSVLLASDGTMWFTDRTNSLLGRIFPDGRYRLFSRGLTRWASGPQFITAGPDGNFWFTEVKDRIGCITPGGRITEYSQGIPKRSSLGGIVAGPDGALWFTLYHGMVLGRITVSGRITLYHDLVYPSDGHGFDPVAMIVTDRAGHFFFNEGQAGRIARVTIR